MNFYMARYSDNYADEFDIDGICFVTQKEKDKFYDALNRLDGLNPDFSEEFTFGGNYGVEYESRKDIWNAIAFIQITEEEYNLMKRVIGSVGFARRFMEFVEEIGGEYETV